MPIPLPPAVVSLVEELAKLIPQGVMDKAIAEIEQLALGFVESKGMQLVDQVLAKASGSSGDITVTSGRTGSVVSATISYKGRAVATVTIDVSAVEPAAVAAIAKELDEVIPGAGTQLEQLVSMPSSPAPATPAAPRS